MKKVFRILLVLLVAFVLVGCGDNGPGKKEEVATSMKIETRKSVIQIGTTLQLNYSWAPATAPDPGAVWSVDKESVATINETGLLTAQMLTSDSIVKVTVKSTDGSLSATKAIKVTVEAPIEYPDLGGYKIKIAQATTALGEWDVWLPEETADTYGYYRGLDKQAKQDAWRSVEDDFNCTIEVVEYPTDAPWGPSRWNYIVNQARLSAPDYDFYVVPDSQVPEFVSGGAIKDLSDWYDAYAEDFMNPMTKTAGSYKNRLYTINPTEPTVYNILGYNVGLWEKINEFDSTILEPAKMFNDGNWDYTTFVDYVKKCQTALNSIYGLDENDKPNYWALSGWPSYYWVGMIESGGNPVADVTALKVNILTDDATAAGDALKELATYGAFDPAYSVDQGVISWNQGRALFNTGDLWFINSNQTRWNADLWGEGENTRYGYVPFPAPDGYDRSRYFTGLTSESCLVMADVRDWAYKGYGDDCNAENIYYAMISYWLRSQQNYQAQADYDPEAQHRATADSKLATAESIKAFTTVNANLATDGFYDPMSTSSNTVCATYASALDIAIRGYVNSSSGASTWAEAVGEYQDTLNKSITDAFG